MDTILIIPIMAVIAISMTSFLIGLLTGLHHMNSLINFIIKKDKKKK